MKLWTDFNYFLHFQLISLLIVLVVKLRTTPACFDLTFVTYDGYNDIAGKCGFLNSRGPICGHAPMWPQPTDNVAHCCKRCSSVSLSDKHYSYVVTDNNDVINVPQSMFPFKLHDISNIIRFNHEVLPF